VGRIYDRLVPHFGRDAVFKDVDSIPYGANFARYIEDVIKQCSVVLAVIGPGWADARDAAAHPRLEDAGDFVRLEIEAALRQQIVVIPVLVQGATMPTPEQLPESLRELSLLNAIPVRRDPDFDADTRRLSAALDRYVPPTRRPPAQPAYAPAGPPLSQGYAAPGAMYAAPPPAYLSAPKLSWRQSLAVALPRGLIFGVIGASLLIIIRIVDLLSGSSTPTALLLETALSIAVFLLVVLIGPIILGYMCGRRTGRITEGLWAAVLGSGIYSATAFVFDSLSASAPASATLPFLLAVIVIGGALGLGGAAIGQRGYRGSTAKKQPQPAAPMTRPTTPTR
jgi:hypothetical protein